MILGHLFLQNFRSYSKSEFTFSENTTVIIGPNTSGKSNLIEAIFLLSTGKSFKTQKDTDMIMFEKQVGRASASTNPDSIGTNNEINLEVVISSGEFEGRQPSKKFLVNKVPKRRVDFAGNLVTVLFSPLDLEIISGSPGIRREFLDNVLEQTDRDYRLAGISYAKALRQRNALLELVRQTGKYQEKQFEYWDNLLIQNGQIITKKREACIRFLNNETKEVFDCALLYDKSIISHDRLEQYKKAEEGAGVTLVGPHRDDFTVCLYNNSRQTTHEVKTFGSRGQQRLVVLQLKLLQLLFVEKSLEQPPLFLLDDIFSELDEEHIIHVLNLLGKQQTILTTTHEEFIPQKIKKQMSVIELIKE
ncbi:MAG: hypothetical protein A3F31_00375 [Candidatus Levybacteria bacterium RIFCSPHIGHO2_12_FULL_38_12]|nr:MAG: hypothetical protein A2770_03445 [Candidatus Levybacteria bacterium RIFCSPHIGHO2_01_FULL_38_12]OGH23214.1 MAG: hypothetical protein A3F31_00375 [Candidatus Levybacteria bacterium RIFCSPHIGHO2_12_FULL_38_12]OGH34492.1 MAG: hypothetical protein A3A47_00895 [Candidatus Levybacteria bacterium RIFCSPLOWO2_01_FULL_37_20]OGH44740.1 MAG: hypothetical protein A3J14_00255 [Candidatus Levybacteria bacterium RIFCSPLOWO2_02_FULL_37_18]